MIPALWGGIILKNVIRIGLLDTHIFDPISIYYLWQLNFHSLRWGQVAYKTIFRNESNKPFQDNPQELLA